MPDPSAGREHRSWKRYANPQPVRASTVLYRDLDEMALSQADPLRREGPVYGRFGTPTVRHFEEGMASLERGWGAVAMPSGLAAATTSILSFAHQGAHVLLCENVYGGVQRFVQGLASFGVDCEFYPAHVGASIVDWFRPSTRAVYLESPGSDTFEVQDIPAIASACRAAGIVTIADNTWATPFFCQPLTLGVDVVVHSASKYLTGHSDALLGVAVCTEKTYPRVRTTSMRLGHAVGAEEAYAGGRGLPSLEVRMRAHQASNLRVLEAVAARPEVARVLHPLHGPDRDLWSRDATGGAGPFGVVLDPRFGSDQVAAMLETFSVFRLGHGWGGFESLVAPGSGCAFRHPRLGEESGAYVRLYVGLEAPDVLLADVDAALAALGRTS